MKIKFQADADLSYTIIKALRRRQPAISLPRCRLTKQFRVILMLGGER